ncbi:helix-turn-helix domain-containing protein [Terrisporobacter petrolearius]|uniref:helix-turn-helix domain-containing protein n=1 Tax=Terrisporobacter petrolearius TaxID=1460447 RepID=UPI0031CCB1EE
MKGKLGTEEENKQVIDMYKRGYTVREIAARLNRSFCFVYTRIDNYRIDNTK